MLDFGGVGFGGDTLGRAALAAALECDGKELHALHASFLRPVPGGATVQLRVEPLSEGRRLTRRRVLVELGGRAVCHVTASFAAPGDGIAWDEASAPAGLPDAEALPSDADVAKAESWTEWFGSEHEIEWRWVGRAWPDPEPKHSSWSAWARPRVPLPDDPRLHAAALAYVSDYQSHWSAARRMGDAFVWEKFASAEHALFVHRPPRWDDWWLLTNRGDVAHGGRCYWHREVWTRDGRLVASIAQHGLAGTND